MRPYTEKQDMAATVITVRETPKALIAKTANLELIGKKTKIHALTVSATYTAQKAFSVIRSGDAAVDRVLSVRNVTTVHHSTMI